MSEGLPPNGNVNIVNGKEPTTRSSGGVLNGQRHKSSVDGFSSMNNNSSNNISNQNTGGIQTRNSGSSTCSSGRRSDGDADSVVMNLYVSNVGDEEAFLVSEEHEQVVRLPLGLLPERAHEGMYVTVRVCVAEGLGHEVASEMNDLQASLLRRGN